MSRAFVKEDAGPDLPDVGEKPVSSNPNWVRPAFLARMRAGREALAAEVAQLREARDEAADLMPLAVAERDLRWLDTRIATAIVVEPSTAQPDVVAFGMAVTVEDEDGRVRTYTLVGEDEADPRAGLVSPFSPLGRALLGAEPGDEVSWTKPGGSETLTVTASAVP